MYNTSQRIFFKFNEFFTDLKLITQTLAIFMYVFRYRLIFFHIFAPLASITFAMPQIRP